MSNGKSSLNEKQKRKFNEIDINVEKIKSNIEDIKSTSSKIKEAFAYKKERI